MDKDLRGIDEKELIKKTSKVLNDTAKELTTLSETEGKINLDRLKELVEVYDESIKGLRYCIENHLPDEKWEGHKMKWNAQMDSNAGMETIPKDVIRILGMLIDSGDSNSFMRYALVQSVKSMLRPYPGYKYYRGRAVRDSLGRLVVESDPYD